MKPTKKRGFVLTLVIVALGLMGVVMAVLTRGTNTMLFHADRAHVRAVERNLTASGLVWARQRALHQETAVSAEPVVLDVRAFNLPQASLAVAFTKVGATAVEVTVESTCAKGRQTSKIQRQYGVALAP